MKIYKQWKSFSTLLPITLLLRGSTFNTLHVCFQNCFCMFIYTHIYLYLHIYMYIHVCIYIIIYKGENKYPFFSLSNLSWVLMYYSTSVSKSKSWDYHIYLGNLLWIEIQNCLQNLYCYKYGNEHLQKFLYTFVSISVDHMPNSGIV